MVIEVTDVMESYYDAVEIFYDDLRKTLAQRPVHLTEIQSDDPAGDLFGQQIERKLESDQGIFFHRGFYFLPPIEGRIPLLQVQYDNNETLYRGAYGAMRQYLNPETLEGYISIPIPFRMVGTYGLEDTLYEYTGGDKKSMKYYFSSPSVEDEVLYYERRSQ